MVTHIPSIRDGVPSSLQPNIGTPPIPRRAAVALAARRLNRRDAPPRGGHGQRPFRGNQDRTSQKDNVSAVTDPTIAMSIGSGTTISTRAVNNMMDKAATAANAAEAVTRGTSPTESMINRVIRIPSPSSSTIEARSDDSATRNGNNNSPRFHHRSYNQKGGNPNSVPTTLKYANFRNSTTSPRPNAINRNEEYRMHSSNSKEHKDGNADYIHRRSNYIDHGGQGVSAFDQYHADVGTASWNQQSPYRVQDNTFKPLPRRNMGYDSRSPNSTGGGHIRENRVYRRSDRGDHTNDTYHDARNFEPSTCGDKSIAGNQHEQNDFMAFNMARSYREKLRHSRRDSHDRRDDRSYSACSIHSRDDRLVNERMRDTRSMHRQRYDARNKHEYNIPTDSLARGPNREGIHDGKNSVTITISADHGEVLVQKSSPSWKQRENLPFLINAERGKFLS